MSKKESILLIEKVLRETITSSSDRLEVLSNIDKAKTKGVIEGASAGLNFLIKLNEGVSYDYAVSTFNNKLRQAIYSLVVAENEYNSNQSIMNNRTECEIAYNDSLVTTLQLLREKFEDIKLRD